MGGDIGPTGGKWYDPCTEYCDKAVKRKGVQGDFEKRNCVFPLSRELLPWQYRWMDYEKISAEALGASLKGIGLNLLVQDVPVQCAFLEIVFAARTHRVSKDFAIVTYGRSGVSVACGCDLSFEPFDGAFAGQPSPWGWG